MVDTPSDKRHIRLNNVYSKEYSKFFCEEARKAKVRSPRGVFSYIGGPSFETIAEAKSMHIQGNYHS